MRLLTQPLEQLKINAMRLKERLESRLNSQFEIQIEASKHKSVVAHNQWKESLPWLLLLQKNKRKTFRTFSSFQTTFSTYYWANGKRKNLARFT